jgi:hypothetical protein
MLPTIILKSRRKITLPELRTQVNYHAPIMLPENSLPNINYFSCQKTAACTM